MFAACYDVPVDPEALLERVGLLDKKKSYPEKLSGGQRQRFSIATTLVNQPRVIFLDEPTTGLDPQARVNLWDMIREIKAAGTTVVMTTHYMEEAEELCDRLAIMDQGKIISMGSPAELIERLLASGFRKPEVRRQASLEDVFLTLTGRSLRDESPDPETRRGHAPAAAVGGLVDYGSRYHTSPRHGVHIRAAILAFN